MHNFKFECSDCGALGDITIEDVDFYEVECCPCCGNALENVRSTDEDDDE